MLKGKYSLNQLSPPPPPKEYLKNLRNDKGFTMIEMMVVLIIIAVLIGGGIRFYLGYIENAKVTKAKSQISNMQALMDSWYTENGSYPAVGTTYLTDLTTIGVKLREAGIRATTNSDKSVGDPWGGTNYYKFKTDTAVDTPATKYYIVTGKTDIQGTGNPVVGSGDKGVSTSPAIIVEP